MLKNKISKENRAKLFNQCVIPVTTYATETWPLTKKNNGKYEENRKKNGTRIIKYQRLRDRVKSETIRRQTMFEDIGGKRIAMNKWSCMGRTYWKTI